MTFENFTEGTHCDCLTGVNENTTSTFVHTLKKDTLRDNDFRSKYERWVIDGKRTPLAPEIIEDCDKMCSYKGVSISNIDEEGSKAKIINFYTSIFPLAQNYKRGVLVFKFKEGAGLVKHTPNENDTQHHDLYKCDTFTFNEIEQLETIYLGQVV